MYQETKYLIWKRIWNLGNVCGCRLEAGNVTGERAGQVGASKIQLDRRILGIYIYIYICVWHVTNKVESAPIPICEVVHCFPWHSTAEFIRIIVRSIRSKPSDGKEISWIKPFKHGNKSTNTTVIDLCSHCAKMCDRIWKGNTQAHSYAFFKSFQAMVTRTALCFTKMLGKMRYDTKYLHKLQTPCSTHKYHRFRSAPYHKNTTWNRTPVPNLSPFCSLHPHRNPASYAPISVRRGRPSPQRSRRHWKAWRSRTGRWKKINNIQKNIISSSPSPGAKVQIEQIDIGVSETKFVYISIGWFS